MTRLAGQDVSVLVEGAGRFSAIVDEDAGAALTLVAAVAPDEPYAGRHAIVEFTSARGVHRLEGVLDSDAGRPGLLRLAREGAEVVQRRGWVRVDAVLPLLLRAEAGVAHTATLNLSAGGTLAADPLSLAVGTPVAFEVILGEPVPGRGVVAARRPGRDRELIGIRFDVMADADRERLARFAMERQRLELRVRSGR